jgi:hypothetical protein
LLALSAIVELLGAALVLAVVPVVVVPVVDAAVLGLHVTPGPLSIVPLAVCAYAGAIASAAKAIVERNSFFMIRSSGYELCLRPHSSNKVRSSATLG